MTAAAHEPVSWWCHECDSGVPGERVACPGCGTLRPHNELASPHIGPERRGLPRCWCILNA